MEDEINIIDLFKVLDKYKFLILGLVFIALLVTSMQTFQRRKFYKATASVLVMQQTGDISSGFSRMLSRYFGGRGGQDGGVLGAIVKSRSMSYAVTQSLQEKNMLDSVLAKRSLRNSSYSSKNFSSLEVISKFVSSSVRINFDGNLLEVTTQSSSAELAAAIANTYVKKLQEYSLKHSLGFSLQPLDPAIPPRFAYSISPWRKIIFSGIIALIVGIMFAFFLNYIQTLLVANNFNIKKEQT